MVTTPAFTRLDKKCFIAFLRLKIFQRRTRNPIDNSVTPCIAKSVKASLITRSLTSMAIAELCYKTLLADGVDALRAAKEKTITPALERVIEANILLSGLGFESAGLAGAHSVHNGLTVVPGAKAYMHGEKVAFGVIAQLMLEKADTAQINQVIAFCKSVGLPTILADIGCANISQDMLAKVAARATIASEFVHNEPFPVTANMVAEAIMAADAAGR